ncbi:hypothetical protein ACET3Z_000140 [Daucus carota]
MGTVDLFVYFCYDKYLPVLFGVRNNFTCFEYATNQYVFGIELLLQNYAATLDSECRIQSQTPVERMVVEKFANDAKMLPGELLKPSFEVYYVFYRTACSKCEKSGGLCWGNTNFGVEYTQCLYEPSGSNLILKIGIGGGVAVISILFLTNPSQRPSISKVIEMFEADLAALEIPAKPYLCSAPTSPRHSQQKALSGSSSLSESTETSSN